MVTASEAAEEYRAVLSDLSRNDKTQINLLTILAEDYASYSSEIVKVIEDSLYNSSIPLKLVMLYVIDSIVKNIQVTGGYRELFAKKIVDMIVHVFKEGDERTRASIYRLRCTWADVFSKSKLAMIDTKINSVDRAWPIMNTTNIKTEQQQQQPSIKTEQQQPLPPTSQQKLQTNVKKEKGEGGGGHVVHVNPKFLNGKGPPPSKRAKTSEATTEKSSDTSGGSSSKQVKPIPRIKQQPQQPRVSKQNVPEPSRSLGAHAFSVVPASQQPQAPPTQQKMQQPPPQQQPIPLSSIIIDQRPPAPVVMIPCTSSASIPPPNLQQPPPQFIKEQPPPQLINIDSIGKTPQQPLTSTFPSPIQNVQHNIQNVTPRLPGVPENNRIFVDGKAYEVFYLDHVAVIERNGLPHRVSFAGPPRDVIIDGIGHCMSFGEQKQVLIDGEIHLLRFGAPSRELYMGNFPFKGAFGGPPIIATINGRRHEIRLCGPPPEVRIDPEPSYELMRYMPAIRQQQQQTPQQAQQRQVQQPVKVETKKEPVLDVTSLLQRLKNSGILSQLNQAERRTHERQAAIEARNTTLGRSNSPPVPCAHRFDHVERRAMPMAGFDLFSMRSLIIRYDSFIDSIHKQRRSCQHCGIGFKELYGEAYQRHIDWHLQDTLRMKDSKYKYTRSQPWFMLEDWFTYSEYELVNKVVSTESDKSQQRQVSPSSVDIGKESSSSVGGQKGLTDINNTGVDAPSDSIETKECCVCHEQFEEYWDEDEDVWRLRDCVVVDEKAFHIYCREDATNNTSTLITEDK